MRTQELSRGPHKICLGVTALIVSMVLLLGSAQNSFAKNHPRPVPWRQSANTAIGTADGGGGGVDVERFGSAQKKHTNPSASLYNGGKSDGGSSGVFILEITPFGYYQVALEIVFLRLSNNLTLISNSEGSRHE